MKTQRNIWNYFLFFALILIAGLSSGCLVPGESGNGNVIRQDRKVATFNGIDVSGAFDIFLTQGSVQSVTVEADENLQKYIRTEVEGRKLVIEEKNPISHSSSLKVHITVTDLKTVELSGAVDATTEGTLSQPELKIETSGATDSKFNLDVQKLAVSSSGGSKLKFGGNAGITSMEISGAADIFAYELLTDNFDLTISGAGKAQINVKKELSVDISGAGSVRYKGNPAKVSENVSGSGSVKKAEE
jgi:hypothetical protein